MRTSRVIEMIEELIGRKMTENEIAEVSRLNDEGWPETVVGPCMREVLQLIEAARENGVRQGKLSKHTR